MFKAFRQGAARATGFLASCAGVLAVMTIVSIAGSRVYAQLQQSGGPGSTVSIGSALPAGSNIVGKFSTDQTTHGTTDLVASDHVKINGVAVATAAAGIQKVGLTDGTGNAITSTAGALDLNIKSGSIANTAFGVSAGVANIGFVRVIPSSCTQSTNFASPTVGVAITIGTTVTSTTTCVTFAYVNNITNSPVTLRLADKAGTPVIWLGGGTDFSIPANSNMRIPIDGVTFTSGITAIAGTAAALNLQMNGLQ